MVMAWQYPFSPYESWHYITHPYDLLLLFPRSLSIWQEHSNGILPHRSQVASWSCAHSSVFPSERVLKCFSCAPNKQLSKNYAINTLYPSGTGNFTLSLPLSYASTCLILIITYQSNLVCALMDESNQGHHDPQLKCKEKIYSITLLAGGFQKQEGTHAVLSLVSVSRGKKLGPHSHPQHLQGPGTRSELHSAMLSITPSSLCL